LTQTNANASLRADAILTWLGHMTTEEEAE